MNMRTAEPAGSPAAIPITAAAGQTAVLQLHYWCRIDHWLQFQHNSLETRPSGAKVSSGIDDNLLGTQSAEALCSAIDGIAFCNSPKIDPQRAMKRDLAVFPEFDIAPGALARPKGSGWPWQESPLSQFGAHGNIEAALRLCGHRQGKFQYLESVPMHRNRLVDRLTIQPADIAGAFVETHQPVDG
jgi:hypothetical protein